MDKKKRNPHTTPPPFAAYIAEKIEISLNATDVKNRGGFIVEAIRENYIDPAVQKERELRVEKAKEKELEEIDNENLLRELAKRGYDLKSIRKNKSTAAIVKIAI